MLASASKLIARRVDHLPGFRDHSSVSVIVLAELGSRRRHSRRTPTGPARSPAREVDCSRNGWVDGALRVNEAPFVVLAAAISPASSSRRRLSKLLQRQFKMIHSRAVRSEPDHGVRG